MGRIICSSCKVSVPSLWSVQLGQFAWVENMTSCQCDMKKIYFILILTANRYGTFMWYSLLNTQHIFTKFFCLLGLDYRWPITVIHVLPINSATAIIMFLFYKSFWLNRFLADTLSKFNKLIHVSWYLSIELGKSFWKALWSSWESFQLFWGEKQSWRIPYHKSPCPIEC